MPLGQRLEGQVLGGADGERQRQLGAGPRRLSPLRVARVGGQRRRDTEEEPAEDNRKPHGRPHQVKTSEEVKTSLSTAGAPSSSRFFSTSALSASESKKSARRPAVMVSTVI